MTRWARGSSLDHLVGAGDEGWRHLEAECLRGFQLDHELELGRLLYRQVGRLLAFENATGIDAGESPRFDPIGAIADETASFCIAALLLDGRDSMPQRELREPTT